MKPSRKYKAQTSSRSASGRTRLASIHPTEDQEQKVLVEWLRATMPPETWFHVPNQRMAKPQYMRKLKSMGVQPGVPDILIIRPFQEKLLGYRVGMAIELKRRKGGQVSEAQARWIDSLNFHKWHAFVACGAQEAIDEIKRCYGSR